MRDAVPGRAGILAGDAAHFVPPFGARGLNSGIYDADNLAWKLAFVPRGFLDGPAADLLLESYDTERRAAALETRRFNAQLLAERTGFGDLEPAPKLLAEAVDGYSRYFMPPAASSPRLRSSCPRPDLDHPCRRSRRAPVSDPDVEAEVRAVFRVKSLFVPWGEQPAQFLVDVGHLAQRIQFPVQGVSTAGDVRVCSQPGAPVGLVRAQLFDHPFQAVDLMVEAKAFWQGDLVVDALRGGLPTGQAVGGLAQMAARPPAVGSFCGAFGCAALAASGVEVTGRFAFGCAGVAPSTCFEVAPRSPSGGEPDLGYLEFLAPIGRGGGFGGLPVGVEAGEAECFT